MFPYCAQTFTNGRPDDWGAIMGDKWIPCTKRWPDIGLGVLVWDGSVFGLDYVIQIDMDDECLLQWTEDQCWTHWQELPAPPAKD